MLRPSSGSASRRTSRAADEPVDAVGHRAARDERLLQQLLRAQLERLARAAQGRQHIPLPRLQVAAAERVAARAVEVAREPVDAREHARGARSRGRGAARSTPRRCDRPRPSPCAMRSIIGARAGHRRRLRAPSGVMADLTGGRSLSGGGRGPPWCNGSTTAFGAVRSRFESWRRSMTDNHRRRRARRHRPRRRPGHAHEVLAARRCCTASAAARSSGTCSTPPTRSRPQRILVVVRHERDLVADAVARHRARSRRGRPGRGPRHRPRGRDRPRAARPTSTATCWC